MPSGAGTTGSLRTAAALAIILLAAAALRSFRLSVPDVWVDEANSVRIAREPFAGMIERLRLDSSPPLYYLLLGAWMRCFGAGEVAIRGLSVLFGVGCVALVWHIGRRTLGTEAGWIAAVLLATSPIHIFYSQQARMYALLTLLATAATYLLCRATTNRAFLFAYAGTLLAALYTHNFAIYLFPAHAALLLLSGALQRAPATWLLTAAVVAAGYSPWIPVLIEQVRNPVQYAWFATFWSAYGPLGALMATLLSFASGGAQPQYIAFPGLGLLSWLAAFLFGTIAVVGIARPRAPTARDSQSPGTTPTLWLLITTIGPLGFAAALSCIVTPNYVPGRVDQLVVGGYVLLVAAGIAALPFRSLRFGGVALAVALSAAVMLRYWSSTPANGDRAVAAAISQHARAGDSIVTTSLTRASLEYYLRVETLVPVGARTAAGEDRRLKMFSYPRDTAAHLGNQDDARLLAQPEALTDEAERVLMDAAERADGPPRIFIALADSPVNQPLADRLAVCESTARFRVQELGVFRGSVTGQRIRLLLAE